MSTAKTSKAAAAATVALRRESAANEHHDGTDLPGTYLVIPYFPGDRGLPALDRPLGTKAVSYLCPSIAVNGVKGSTTFKRGVPTTVTVDVANFGKGTTVAPVQVAVWWADPSTGFTTLNPFGQASVPVPTGGQSRTSPPITNVIPLTALPHSCLLARVSSPFDAPAAGAPVAPADDRHFAQLNLNEIAVQPGQTFKFTFWAGNPFDRAAAFDVSVRQLPRAELELLGRRARIDLVPVEEMELSLQRHRLDVLRHGAGDAGGALVLEPGARKGLTVTGILPRGVEPGQATAFEIVQTAQGRSRDAAGLVGSIGVIVTASMRD